MKCNNSNNKNSPKIESFRNGKENGVFRPLYTTERPTAGSEDSTAVKDGSSSADVVVKI